jgi:hypothetical protein
MLARGYIVRVHVANVLASASLLQRVIRRFLARNKQRILQTGAARKMQVIMCRCVGVEAVLSL